VDPLQALTIDTFRDRAGEAFRDTAAGFELVLAEVEELGPDARHSAPDARTPFSLVFRGPLRPMLEQGIRPLAHDALGELPLFLVPIAAEPDGMRYQAVFS
jgi:hypothetical protein